MIKALNREGSMPFFFCLYICLHIIIIETRHALPLRGTDLRDDIFDFIYVRGSIKYVGYAFLHVRSGVLDSFYTSIAAQVVAVETRHTLSCKQEGIKIVGYAFPTIRSAIKTVGCAFPHVGEGIPDSFYASIVAQVVAVETRHALSCERTKKQKQGMPCFYERTKKIETKHALSCKQTKKIETRHALSLRGTDLRDDVRNCPITNHCAHDTNH